LENSNFAEVGAGARNLIPNGIKPSFKTRDQEVDQRSTSEFRISLLWIGQWAIRKLTVDKSDWGRFHLAVSANRRSDPGQRVHRTTPYFWSGMGP